MKAIISFFDCSIILTSKYKQIDLIAHIFDLATNEIAFCVKSIYLENNFSVFEMIL